MLENLPAEQRPLVSVNPGPRALQPLRRQCFHAGAEMFCRGAEVAVADRREEMIHQHVAGVSVGGASSGGEKRQGQENGGQRKHSLRHQCRFSDSVRAFNKIRERGYAPPATLALPAFAMKLAIVSITAMSTCPGVLYSAGPGLPAPAMNR